MKCKLSVFCFKEIKRSFARPSIPETSIGTGNAQLDQFPAIYSKRDLSQFSRLKVRMFPISLHLSLSLSLSLTHTHTHTHTHMHTRACAHNYICLTSRVPVYMFSSSIESSLNNFYLRKWVFRELRSSQCIYKDVYLNKQTHFHKNSLAEKIHQLLSYHSPHLDLFISLDR